MEAAQHEHLKMIQEIINRLATCSFQLKGWIVALKGEAHPIYLFVPALPVIAFCLLDAWYLRHERLFRGLYDDVRCKEGVADFSMDARPSVTPLDRKCRSPLHRRCSCFTDRC